MLSATITHAKPNLTYGTGNYAGPASMWNTSNGFLVQSSYSQNFPTTGADGLYFDLLVSGVDARCLTWENVPVGNIKATVQAASASTVRVTLTGPTRSNPLAFKSPTQIEIKGKQGSSTIVSYGFELQKWFINNGLVKGSFNVQKNWCNGVCFIFCVS